MAGHSASDCNTDVLEDEHDGDYDTATHRRLIGSIASESSLNAQLTGRANDLLDPPPLKVAQPCSTTAPRSHGPVAPSVIIGLVLVILSTAAYASMSLLVSLAAQRGVPSMLSATFRFAAQTALSIAWIAYAHRGKLCAAETWLGKPANRQLLVQRGILGAVAMCGLFYAVSTAPLADATCIAFLNVPITVAVAAVVLGEQYTFADGLAGAASAIGVVLVVQPLALFGGTETSAPLSLLSVASGLLYALFSALVFVTIRAIGPGESALVLVLYFGITGCFVAPLLLITLQASNVITLVCVFRATKPSGDIPKHFDGQQVPSLGPPKSLTEVLGLEAGICTLGFVGQVILNRGLQLAPAGPASVRYQTRSAWN